MCLFLGFVGAGARDGPAHLDQIAAVKLAAPNIPIISNGNIITWEDVCSNLALTHADGVMSAEGILDNPSLFSPGALENTQNGAGAGLAVGSSRLELAQEYLSLLEQFPAKMKSVIFHIRRMLKQELISYQMLDECLAAADVTAVRTIVEMCSDYKGG